MDKLDEVEIFECQYTLTGCKFRSRKLPNKPDYDKKQFIKHILSHIQGVECQTVIPEYCCTVECHNYEHFKEHAITSHGLVPVSQIFAKDEFRKALNKLGKKHEETKKTLLENLISAHLKRLMDENNATPE